MKRLTFVLLVSILICSCGSTITAVGNGGLPKNKKRAARKQIKCPRVEMIDAMKWRTARYLPKQDFDLFAEVPYDYEWYY